MRNQQPANSLRQGTFFPPDPIVDIQRLAQASTGEMLPVFGRDLFQRAPSTFAPTDEIPVMADYLVGPGDVILLRLWGPESFNGQLTVDSSGSIYVPQVGAVHVAGLRADQLQSQISSELKHSFRNFNLSVNLGHLRSLQVYVVGEARRPGAYTVSSLSTVLNVLFASGGPNVQGSMRHIQVRRQGEVVTELDLYDLLLKGDKSHDIRLQPEDTIFIPSVGPQVALAGSVHHPAIYELRNETTIGAVLELAGGFTPTSSTTQLSLERIEDHSTRAAMTVKLDSAGRATILRDGDVLFVNHIMSAYQKSVTIRGNLANPGRFPWHPGMRLSDIIPDRMSLLTGNYWQQRNRLGVPVPLFEPLPRLGQTQQLGNLYGNNPYGQSRTTTGQIDTGQRSRQNTMDSEDRQDEAAYDQDSPVADQQLRNNSRSSDRPADTSGSEEDKQRPSDATLSSGSLAESQKSGSAEDIASRGRPNKITIPAPEIDWSYAVIERLDPNTLRNSLVPFSLEKLLQAHDPTQDLELQPGDIVTILSQSDVRVSQDEQTKYVRLEGEFKSAGVYSVSPGETLDQLVARAGGLTSKAYLYGASFTRESARVFQQQRLDEYITSVAINMQRAAAVQAASSSTSSGDANALVEQREIVAQLRKLRATGRIVLEFRPDSQGLGSIPSIPLEDGDVFRIPPRPLTVNVIGAVYGQNVFLYDPKRRVEDYVLLAGNPNQIADRKHAFIIRADGSVFSRERAQGLWGNTFATSEIHPGDSIVIPEKPVRPSFVRQFIDYSQIFSQFALGAAALSVVKSN
jgi:protein involved in polysaccharide export with SLBB domain